MFLVYCLVQRTWFIITVLMTLYYNSIIFAISGSLWVTFSCFFSFQFLLDARHHEFHLVWIKLLFSSVAQWCPTLCDPMKHSTPGLPVHRQLPEFNQTHVHQVGEVIQPAHPLLSPSPSAPNPSQHQGLSQWVNSLYEVAKVLEFQPQHQSFQWTPRTGLL